MYCYISRQSGLMNILCRSKKNTVYQVIIYLLFFPCNKYLSYLSMYIYLFFYTATLSSGGFIADFYTSLNKYNEDLSCELYTLHTVAPPGRSITVRQVCSRSYLSEQRSVGADAEREVRCSRRPPASCEETETSLNHQLSCLYLSPPQPPKRRRTAASCRTQTLESH